VVLRLPPRKVAVDAPAGGGPKRPPPPARRHPVRRPVVPPREIPPPVAEQQPPPLPPLPDLEPVAEFEDAGDDDGDLDASGPPGVGGGGGTGTGTGTGVGPGTGSVKSRARKAWIARTDWRCRRPGYDELGRVVVRIRVEVLLDGSPGQVTVVRAGPEDFNRRAVDCAKDETYLPALDPEGRPIPGSAEFSIEFLN
jgi:protein TonB